MCRTKKSYIPRSENRFELISNYQPDDPPQNCKHTKSKPRHRLGIKTPEKHRIILMGDSKIHGCAEKLASILGSAYKVVGITKPNTNLRAIINSYKQLAENLTKKDVMIICGCTRDVARNEAKEGLRTISEFAKLTSNTSVIVMCVPQRFDLQPTSCVNQEVIAFTRKLSHVHVCNMSITRNHFTYHGLHLNSQGKNWITNKWKPTITSMTSKLTTVPTTTTTITPSSLEGKE